MNILHFNAPRVPGNSEEVEEEMTEDDLLDELLQEDEEEEQDGDEPHWALRPNNEKTP